MFPINVWAAGLATNNRFRSNARLSSMVGISFSLVIAFASTNFGADWPGQVEAASKSTGAPDPSFTRLDNWGHLDVLAGTKSESQVFTPTAAWIKQHEK